MSDLKLQWMADELHDAGLKVIEHSGWKTRSIDKPYPYNPVGLLNHHTAGSSILTNYPNPPFWPFTSLDDKCNITIQPDGYVVCLNAGIANDSGMGDPAVLDRVLRDWAVGTPQDHSSADRVTGNPWFIDIEVQHRGDGGVIVPVQREALIKTNAVIMKHYNWNPDSRLLGHREWTVRKIDPRWGGFSNPMPGIRADTKEVMTMTKQEILDTLGITAAQLGRLVQLDVAAQAERPVTIEGAMTRLFQYEKAKDFPGSGSGTGLQRGDSVTLQ